MLVTAQMLRDLGTANVIALPSPVSIINGGVVLAKTLKYESLEEIKLANWFRTASDPAALLIICEGGSDGSDSYTIRLFDLSQWDGDDPRDEDEFSPLALHRARLSGRLQPITID